MSGYGMYPQAMLPLSDQVHYGLSVAEYHTARLKFMLGRGMEGPAHLGIALQAIQAALMQNPGCAPTKRSPEDCWPVSAICQAQRRS